MTKERPDADRVRALSFFLPQSSLLAQEVQHDLLHVGGGQAELLQQLPAGAGAAELVVDADPAHGGGPLLDQQGAHRLAQAADDAVLLGGDDLAALLGGLEDDLLVQRPDGCLLYTSRCV